MKMGSGLNLKSTTVKISTLFERLFKNGAGSDFQNSRNNAVSNIVQQLTGLLLAIIVPMVMKVEAYAQVVVVNVLLSYITLADLGMSLVYTRILPSLYSNNKRNEINKWNTTLSLFRLYSSLIFGGVITIYYFQRYPYYLDAVLLFVFVIFSIVTLFVTINATVQSDFRYIRNISIAQSMGRLSILPGSWIAGVKGWIFGQLFGTLVIFYNQRFRGVLHESLSNRQRMDWTLIKANLPQGILLSMITTLWMQLLSSGRIYAAFFYPDAVVAQYGLVGSIYQIVLSMSIAIFVPQTIKIYRLVEHDKMVAIDYAFKLVIYSAPIFILLGFSLTYIAPIAVEIIFPKYNIDRGLYAPLMLSLFNSAVMVTQGSLLIGMGKVKQYLFLIVVASIAYFGFVFLFSFTTNYLAAAEAQLITMSTYSIALVIIVKFISEKNMVKKSLVWLACIPSVAAPILYFILR